MGKNGNPDVITEIQALVSDKLQVVSYKWLSRNFLVSSNDAKRLLQEFVEKHGSDLKVIYALSGWSKDKHQTYYIRLVPRLQLAVVKREFEDGCSVEVYSVQACIPKDPAALWSAEFVQAEELFDQPSTVDNCLRDNRFSAVSNCFVKRDPNGKPVGFAPPPLKNGVEIPVPSKTSGALQPQVQSPQLNPKFEQPSSLKKAEIKMEPVAQESHAEGNKLHTDKERIPTVPGNKKKAQSDKSSSGNGGSLTTLWGRASVKSKLSYPVIETTKDVPQPILCAEAQICAREAADSISSDDDALDFSFKRDSNGGRGRKRRVVFDFSDNEDEDENVVRLSSPDPPKGDSVLDYKSNTGSSVLDKKEMSFEELKGDTLDITKQKLVKNGNGLTPKEDSETANKSKSIGIESHLPECLNDKSKKNKEDDAGATSPKRRKVLKTRIDERGREVTEVVWEGEALDSSNTDKTKTTSSVENRHPAPPKTPAAGTTAPTNSVSKVGNKKVAKGGAKDAKQGNILSFFKKA